MRRTTFLAALLLLLLLAALGIGWGPEQGTAQAQVIDQPGATPLGTCNGVFNTTHNQVCGPRAFCAILNVCQPCQKVITCPGPGPAGGTVRRCRFCMFTAGIPVGHCLHAPGGRCRACDGQLVCAVGGAFEDPQCRFFCCQVVRLALNRACP